jgi:transcriptional regulator with XRE-family HTH domain
MKEKLDDQKAINGMAMKAGASDEERLEPVEEEDSGQVGVRLRALRQAKGMSARELADRSGVTAAYISRLETGKMSPTVATLSRVVQGLGESVGALFGTGSDEGPVVRANQRRVVRNHGVEDYRITPSWADRLEVLETVVHPGQGSGAADYSHQGDQECVLILEGTLTIWLAEVEYTLTAGDSLTFACRSPHRWKNPTSSIARTLWIITPATY